MRRSKFLSTIIILSSWFLAMCTSCSSNHDGWSISGVLEGACDSTLFIEEPSGSAWIIIDSLKTNGSGEFEYNSSDSLAFQAIYRLRLGDRAVYFPVEGAEALTLKAKAKDMDKNHKLSGSLAAIGFNTVDSLFSATIDRLGEEKAVNSLELLSNLGSIILNDTTCIVSYYTIMRPMGKRSFFNVSDKKKLGLIGAAATKYSHYRPNDPRGTELKELHQNAKKSTREGQSGGNSMQATLSGRPYLKFVRQDEKGKDQDLDTVLDRGGVTIVNMTRYDHTQSSANTAALGQLYSKYKDKGLEIYQIGFDSNEGLWRQNAGKMPWITVYCRPSEAEELMMTYNANPIDGAPQSFIFNRNGELVARIANPSELESAVAKLM